MKRNLRVIAVLILVMFGSSVMAQDYSNAGAYMQYFSEQYKHVSKDMWDYTSAIARGKNARKVENRRKDLMVTIKQAKSKIGAVRPYKEDSGLRDSMVSYLQLNYDLLHDDYEKIVDLEEIAEQSYDQMEMYIKVRKQASKKLNDASESLEFEQKRFGVTHNVSILEDDSKLGKKLERAGKAFDYYDEVFLIYFKSEIQEANMVEAFNKGDMNAAEQSKNSLKQFSVEGIENLQKVKPYNGDASLTVACKNLFLFYKKESELKAPVIIDFYLKKDNFEKIRASMEAKGKSATNEDIAEYNKSMKDYNMIIDNFNKTNNELNKERSEKHNAWINAVKNFLDKHAG